MLTPERRAELRTITLGRASLTVLANDLAALLDAADERDRLLRTVSEMTDNLIDAGYSEAELGAERAALAATVERVRALAVEYEEHALREGYGGELWSTTAAAIRRALDGADDE